MDCNTINQKDIFILHCPYCSFLTLILSKLLDHFKLLHSTIDCLYSLYECFHCGIISTSSALLAEHSTIAHANQEMSVRCIYQNNGCQLAATGDMEYSCLFCCYKAAEPKNLTLHYFAFHNVKNVAPLFTCSAYSVQPTANTVGPIVDSQKYLSQKDEVSECLQSDCSKGETVCLPTSPTTATSSALTAAFPALDGSPSSSIMRPFKCTNCGNTYRKRKYFAEHVISCSKSLQLTCPCGRACKWRSNFYAHRKSCAVYNQLMFGNGGSSVGRRRPFINGQMTPNSLLPTLMEAHLEATTLASLPGCIGGGGNGSDLAPLAPVPSQSDPVCLWDGNLSTGVYTNGMLGVSQANYNMLTSINTAINNNTFPNVFNLPAPVTSTTTTVAVEALNSTSSSTITTEHRLSSTNSSIPVTEQDDDDDCIVLKEEPYPSGSGFYPRSSLSFSDVGVGIKHTSNR